MSRLAVIFLFCFLSALPLLSYDLPLVNLGSSSFLDGGPLRSKPGWYYQQYLQTYFTNKFLDHKGDLVGAFPSPKLRAVGTTLQGIYVAPFHLLWASPGIDITLPMSLHSSIETNELGITTAGQGLGDLLIGVFLQFRALLKDERTKKLFLSPAQPLKSSDLLWLLNYTQTYGKLPIKPLFVHRLEFVTSFPTGKSTTKPGMITPGNGFFFIDPYWAFTLFFTSRLSTSCRIHYLWCAQDKTGKRAGTALHGSYTLEYAIKRNLYCGLNGFFLYQLTETKQNGISIPHSKEQLVGVGPGGLYAFGKRLSNVLCANFYWEVYARNRTKGFKLNFRFLKYF